MEFDKATEELEDFVYNNSNFLDILGEIGAIPESIEHDSTEEKLFSKVSDIILSRAFIEIGLNSEVLKQRAIRLMYLQNRNFTDIRLSLTLNRLE